MRTNLFSRSKISAIIAPVFIITLSCEMKKIEPPVAEKIKKELTIHDHTRIDNYYWLKDREDPKVIEYLKAENEYLEKTLKHTKKFQKNLFKEIVGRIKQTDESVPYFKNGYWYYYRYEEGKEYPIYCRKKESLESEEDIMLNVNELAEGFSFYEIGGMSVSPDNKILAYGVDTLSRRLYTVYFKNLETGEIINPGIINTNASIAWANDNKTLFYAQKDVTTLRPYIIKRHKLGNQVEMDELIFEENDEIYISDVYRSKSGEYIMIGSFSTLSTEYQILRTNDPDGQFKIFQPREKGHEYYLGHFKDKFYINTNWNAQNFRLMASSLDKTTKDNWEELIPHREKVYLSDIDIFEKYLVVSEREEGLTKLRIIKWEDNSEYYLPFEEEVYEAYPSVNPEFETDWLRFEYSSLTTPNSTYDFNMVTKEKVLKKQQEVIGDFSPDNYEAKRLYAEINDSIKVPISLVYRKGIELNGSNPLLLYGYGSYGHTIDPYFSSVRLSLLDRGFVYAIAHVRGGQINGRPWYDDGKMLKKKNTFTDFIACAETLIEKGYTSNEKLCALGGSAGGLLMGAIVNMKPELFKAVIAAVPFVDVITTMLDETIPLTTGEYDEWGNPNEKKYYDYILSYSPYDQVEVKDYPSMLVTTGLHDSQVQYWEPAKWVAKLRDMKTDDNVLLLFTNMKTGHGGASGRFERYKETALEYAFLLDQVGINK
ncbi:S9 family peptidase [Bacteroidota bacterium]